MACNTSHWYVCWQSCRQVVVFLQSSRLVFRKLEVARPFQHQTSFPWFQSRAREEKGQVTPPRPLSSPPNLFPKGKKLTKKMKKYDETELKSEEASPRKKSTHTRARTFTCIPAPPLLCQQFGLDVSSCQACYRPGGKRRMANGGGRAWKISFTTVYTSTLLLHSVIYFNALYCVHFYTSTALYSTYWSVLYILLHLHCPMLYIFLLMSCTVFTSTLSLHCSWVVILLSTSPVQPQPLPLLPPLP